ncbi:unnamed protein product [Malus baccata var. baccata]
MTRSSHPIREHILDFDDDFERELRRKRKNPEPSESSSNSEAKVEFEEEEPTARAKDWLYELAPGTVISWESMKRAFLEKFFPTSRVILLRKRISGIQQDEGESFPTYYERFKSLVASCPQHQMKEELLLQYFYEGLLPIERQMLDASAGGALVDKTPTAAKTLISNPALNAQQYEGVGQRSNPQQHQVNEASAITELQNQMANLTTLLSQVVKGPKVQNVAACGGMQTRDKKVDELEKQVGQIAEFMGQFREQGKLPSSTVVNQKVEKLMIKKEEQKPPTVKVETPLPQALCDPKSSNLSNRGKNVSNPVPTNVFPSNVPFPNRFKQTKKEEAEKDILETFRKVQVNIPLLDAIKQVPRFESVMLDLGASINVMPYSIYASMNLGELKNDGVIIQLADRSNAYPKGVLEDVLVQVNHLIFPADFYILEMDESDHAPSLPILLGRPFMKTARTKIDVFNGTLTMEFDGEVINFNLSDSMKFPSENHSCFSIDIIDSLAQDHFDNLKHDALELVIAQGKNMKNIETTSKETHGMHEDSIVVPPSEDIIEMVAALESLPSQTVQIQSLKTQQEFKVNGHRLKPYYEAFEEQVVENVPLHAMGPVQA